MGPHDLANFYKKLGYRVCRTESSYWYEIYPFCWQSIPYHYLINPSANELRSLCYHRYSFLLRFFTHKEHQGIPGSIWICNDSQYNLKHLESKSRNQTRRGLEVNQIQPVDFDALRVIGWELLAETARRQGRKPDFRSANAWLTFCSAAKGVSDMDAWGAFYQGRLVAFLVGAKIDDYYYIFYQASESAYLKSYPNNALIYTVTQVKLAAPGISAISYGLDSVEDTPGLRKFKQGMGFTPHEITQRLVINPLINWVNHKVILNTTNYLLTAFPQSNLLRKAKGLLKLLSSNEITSIEKDPGDHRVD